MVCLFAVVAAFFPRVALVLIWLFTDLVTRAFDTFLWPLIGLIFLPFTTIMFVISWSPVTHISGIGWLWLAIGLLLDLSSYRGSDRSRRRARQS